MCIKPCAALRAHGSSVSSNLTGVAMALRHRKIQMTPKEIQDILKTEHAEFAEAVANDKMLGGHNLKDLAENCSIIACENGRTVFFQADVSYEWFYILDGAISAYVFTTGGRDMFKTLKKNQDASLKAKKLQHQLDRHSDEEVRRSHCKGEVLVLGANGTSIEPLPVAARRSVYHTEEHRKRLGRKVATMGKGSSFGQVGLLNRSVRSATIVSEGSRLLVIGKSVYDRCIRHMHLDKPPSIDLKVQLLRCHYAFSSWPVRQLTRLAFSVNLQRLKKKEILFKQDSKATGIFIVASGTVKCSVIQTVYKDPLIEKKMQQFRERRNEALEFSLEKDSRRGGGGGASGHGNAEKIKAKCALELCDALALLGLESLGPKRFPRYTCDAVADVDSQVLYIPVGAIQKLLSVTEKEAEDGFLVPEVYKNMLDTVSKLQEYFCTQANWWHLRRDFVKGYHNVNCDLSVDIQARHYNRPCGRCGMTGHLPNEESRCKFGGISGISDILKIAASKSTSSQIQFAPPEEEAKWKRQEMIDIGLDSFMEKHLTSKKEGAVELDYMAKKARREKLLKKREMQINECAPPPESPERIAQLLNEARNRLVVSKEETITKELVIPEIVGATTPTTDFERQVDDALSKASVPTPPRHSRRYAHRRRPKVWDTLSKSLTKAKLKKPELTDDHHSEKAIMRAPITASDNLKASLNLKHRHNGHPPMTLMLKDAYPQLSALHHHKLKGLNNCRLCGEPGHNVLNCPHSGISNLEARRVRKNLMRSRDSIIE